MTSTREPILGRDYVNVFVGDEWRGLFIDKDSAEAWLKKAGVKNAEITPLRGGRPVRSQES